MSIERVRELRRDPGEPERVMWQVLHSFRQQGYHFRRQAAIGPYYADFACHHGKLVIEVDGDSHAGAEAYDERRDAYMRARGYQVLRISNHDVVANRDGVFTLVAQLLEGVEPLTPTPVPSPQGGGRRRSRKHGADGKSPTSPQNLPPPCGEGTGVGVGRKHGHQP
ncbi:DUF559 domain-containing protein [Devosia sp. D6-9]|nr:DUF559 domain-containing protein [Devosia sp. D6-9]